MQITSQYLISEEKAVMATSKAEALEVEVSSLRKDLIAAMDINNVRTYVIHLLGTYVIILCN